MSGILSKETTKETPEKERFSEDWGADLRAASRKAKWTSGRFLYSHVTAASLQTWSVGWDRWSRLRASESSKVTRARYDAEPSDIKPDSTVLIRVAPPKNRLRTFYRTDSLRLKDRTRILAKFADKLSSARSSELDFDRRVAQEFEQYARQIVATQGITLVSVSIRQWTSLEDPTWKQLIIAFMVEAKPETALALWDNLSDELSTFIGVRYGTEASELHELLSVAVRW